MSELYRVENGRVLNGDGKPTPVVDDPEAAGQIGPQTLAENYDIIASGNGYGVAVPIRFQRGDEKPDLDRQLSAGAGGQTLYGESVTADWNPEFHFPENIRRYREMRMDAQIRSALKIAKSPVLAARWFMAPPTNNPQDIRRSEWIWANLSRHMSTSWSQMLMEMLYMVDYGFSILEKVFIRDDDGLVRWKKWVPIHPLEVVETNYDSEGGYESVTVVNANGDEVSIPIEKLLIFTYDKESGGMEGNSALRSCYKHWFIKENLLKIDAIQKERHSIGIPIIMLPMHYDRQRDVPVAHKIGRELRGNESAHVVLPPGWEIQFAKLEGQSVDPIQSANYHGKMIQENFLINFTDEGGRQQHQGGTDETFMKGTRFIAEVVRDIVNKHAIPQLYDWNWGEPKNGYPQLKVRRLGDTTDWRTMSFAHRNYVGAKMLTPDDELEDWVREEMDLPMRDPDTAREVEDTQGAGNTPRQTSPSSGGTPSSNAGADNSGG